MNTDKDFAPYQQSLDMKELGFDEPCFGVYATKDGYVRKSGYDENGDAPTFSQAFRWFREKYKIFSSIMTEYSYGGTISAYHINGLHQSDISKGDFYTYEEAELECLKKLIEITKKK
jgi:hypothetical protein